MKSFNQFAVLVTGLFVFGACEKADEARITGMTMRIGLQASEVAGSMAGEALPMKDDSGSPFTLTEARVNVRHLQFDALEAGTASESITIEGPFIFDLVNQSTDPDLSEMEVSPGVYGRIDIRFDDAEEEDALLNAGDPLLDNSMHLQGSFSYDGDSQRSFTMILKFNEDLRFEDPYGILIEEGTSNDILLRLDVSQWLKGVDITSCLEDGDLELEADGSLLINDEGSSCGDIENTIKENIKNNYDFN